MMRATRPVGALRAKVHQPLETGDAVTRGILDPRAALAGAGDAWAEE